MGRKHRRMRIRVGAYIGTVKGVGPITREKNYRSIQKRRRNTKTKIGRG